jgi:3,4-dihydroxy 2-butanone 4-phosphate synthase/GTP cyclohydrolase II
MKFHSTIELIEDMKAGKMVILVDDEDRENEGDLVVAADYITPQIVNFMAVEARGLICLSLTSEQIDRLDLPLMVKEEGNRSPNGTAFTVSVEAARGVSTGISAADRALTIKVASSPSAKPDDIIVPGHVFPIRAQDGGVLKRAGHTEASVDLVRLAGLNPAAVICEIMNPDGTMARFPELIAFAEKHNVKIGSIEALIQHRLETESFVVEKARANLPSRYGKDFRIHVFHNKLDGREHIAIVKGELSPEKSVVVRVHSECLMGDVFRSLSTRSGDNLEAAMNLLAKADVGVLVYLRLEDSVLGSLHPDDRDYGVGAQILHALGVHKIRLVTNTHAKRVGIKGYGLEIVEEISLPVETEPLLDAEV